MEGGGSRWKCHIVKIKIKIKIKTFSTHGLIMKGAGTNVKEHFSALFSVFSIQLQENVV